MFQRLGPWMHDHKWWVIAAWVLVLVSANGVASSLGDGYGEGGDLPDIEAKRGFDLLESASDGADTGQSGRIVFRAEQGVADPQVQATMEDLFAAVEANEFVDDVVSPYQPDGAFQVSSGGDIAFAEVKFDPDMEFSDATDVRDLVTQHIDERAAAFDDIQVELGGTILAEFDEPSSEILGLAFAIVILIAAFGSVLAMGLPIGVALFGIGIGSASVVIISNVMTVPEFAPFLGAMIGLGVGIDYALLIVTRYREQHHAGHDVRESVGIAIDTAGRSVLFAGATVVISLLGMVLMGVSFVQGLAVAASTVVAVTVLASLTLLPALLALAGPRVEVTRRRGLIAAGLVALGLVGVGLSVSPLLVGFPLAVLVLVAGFFLAPLKAEVPRRKPKPRRETIAYRWSRVVQHRPWSVAIGSAAVLLVLAVPVLSLRLGFSDESNYAPETSTRKAYDLIEEGFGPGYAGRLLLVAEVTDATDQAALAAIGEAAAADDGVAFASPPQLNEAGTVATWVVIPTTGPQDEATSDLVRRLRDDVLPDAEAAAGTEVFVTGSVAINVDFAALLASRLPWFFGAVLVLSFLLLMTVFRSLLVPLKAVIMNLLSIGAAYGIAVALFQWGWLSDLTGVQPAPIEPWVPMMLFAIVFGLSMDYEVFLLSRIQEEWHRSGDARTSVADGLAATAKVITAAAAIMVFVFGAFILENDRVVKLMGTGLATAILLDATIVRMLLVPATMELLGDRNWWLPRWLDRILPTIDVEGHDPHDTPDDDPDPDAEPVLAGA